MPLCYVGLFVFALEYKNAPGFKYNRALVVNVQKS